MVNVDYYESMIAIKYSHSIDTLNSYKNVVVYYKIFHVICTACAIKKKAIHVCIGCCYSTTVCEDLDDWDTACLLCCNISKNGSL